MEDKSINLQGKCGAVNCITLLQITLGFAENDRRNSYSLLEVYVYVYVCIYI